MTKLNTAALKKHICDIINNRVRQPVEGYDAEKSCIDYWLWNAFGYEAMQDMGFNDLAALGKHLGTPKNWKRQHKTSNPDSGNYLDPDFYLEIVGPTAAPLQPNSIERQFTVDGFEDFNVTLITDPTDTQILATIWNMD